MTRPEGTAGAVLRVDLTTGTLSREQTPVDHLKDYLGGRGSSAYYMHREIDFTASPLGPENKLIFMTGPLAGSLIPGNNKINVAFKSPLTNSYSFSLCGGHWGPELKFAGYDGLIVEGKSEAPVYLWIDDDRVELRPAGEKLNKMACITTGWYREFGRGGCGAVMGGKQLKAIAIRGTGDISFSDVEGMKRLSEKLCRMLAEHPKARASRGTTRAAAKAWVLRTRFLPRGLTT